jgi:hypothetical protein
VDILFGLFVLSLALNVYLYFELNSYDGAIYLGEDEDVTTYFLDLKYDPEEIGTKKRILFKVIVDETSGA